VSRRGQLDAVVAGGGVVGAATALMLAREGLQVALVEPQRPSPWRADARDLRVYAFAPDNARLLGELGVWSQVAAARVQPYRGMRVWDAAGGAPLVFDADALGQPQLGWIVENALLVDALWRVLPATGVRLHCPARIEAIEQDATRVRVQLDDGLWLEAAHAIAADGAHSALRAMAGIGIHAHDYAQHGIVAFVASERPHQATCWQRFLPGGPVALLPFADADAAGAGDTRLRGRIGSIVWTLPDDEAARLLAADDATFARELEAALDGELGAMRMLSPRAGFPLRRQLASTCLQGRVLLLGDAAHAVHPLAGQGVNLGLRDVTALQALVRAGGLGSSHRLARWARTRTSENAVNALAFEAINRAYSNDALLPVLLRGHLLGIAGKLPPLARALWRHAAGM
jgi:2-octaprenyl-3-methyl-6-methoxy-1,4-benzoquinol hydroxylase